MATYLCFSDECGDYKPKMKEKPLKAHPYYIRTTLFINSNEWRVLNNNFRNLKKKYSIPLSKELKWNNIWTLRKLKQQNKPIPNNIEHLKNADYNKLISFVEEVLNLINTLNEKKIIITYTKNSEQNNFDEKKNAMFSFRRSYGKN